LCGFTAFIAWPVALVLFVVGVVKLVTQARPTPEER